MKIRDAIFQIKSLSFDETLEYLVTKAKKKGEKCFVVTINSEIIMLARRDPEYEEILKSANLALVDGIGAVWAGKMFGKSFKGRVHGSDLVEKLSQAVTKQPITVGFLGGKGNVAKLTAECLVSKYPGLKVAFAASEWPGLEVDKEVSSIQYPVSSKKILNTGYSILNTPIDILFVAFGAPKQEIWIYDNLPNIDVRVAIGVGGAFDFISGKVRRAPKFVRSLGLEWLFRLIIQPWRIKRQTNLLKFVILVLIEKISG